MSERPNILWICTDQQRFDTLRFLGNDRIRTPRLDRLASEGVTLTQAYCQSPVCSPSRASFLTGRYPRATRCRQNGQSIPPDERLVSRILADQGYRCGLAGKLHLASCSDGKVEDRIDDGYEEFHWSHHPQPDWPENAYTQWLVAQGKTWDELYAGPNLRYVKEGIPAAYHQTHWCAEMAIKFLDAHRSDGKPWLFSVNPFAPHHPFDPPAEYLERYRPEEMPIPQYRAGELDGKPIYQQLDHRRAHNSPDGMEVDTLTPAEQQRITAAYYAMIEQIDDEVGRMLDALEATGQRERTIVIFMSDHGEMLGDHGMYLKGPHFYDEAIHVPLIISWPGQIAQGLRREALIELVDLAPTLLELTGSAVEPQIQGRSFRHLLDRNVTRDFHRESVFCEYYNAWTHPGSYGTMLRTPTAKVVSYAGSEPGELYDLVADPKEFVNLWDSPAHKELKLSMLKRCFDSSVYTLDPMPPRRGPF